MARVAGAAEDLSSSSATDDNEDERTVITSDEMLVEPSNYFTCMVCMTTARSAHVSFCGHHFCGRCIRKWIKTQNRCPYCQAFVSKHTLIPINNKPFTDPQTVLERRQLLPQESKYKKISAVLPEIGMFLSGNIEVPLGRLPRFKPLPPQMLKEAPNLPVRAVLVAPNLFQRAMTLIILLFIFAMCRNAYKKE